MIKVGSVNFGKGLLWGALNYNGNIYIITPEGLHRTESGEFIHDEGISAFNYLKTKTEEEIKEVYKKVLEKVNENISAPFWVLVSPDSEEWTEKDILEDLEYLANLNNVEATSTGETRDAGFGEEKLFILRGAEEDVGNFEFVFNDWYKKGR